MTGSEIAVGAALAAKKAVGKLQEDAESDKAALVKLAQDRPAMTAADDAYAKRVAIRQVALLRVYEPLARLLGISQEYFRVDFAAEMAEKTQAIPEENLSTPSPQVAIPAMQGLSYSLDEPGLKEMYLNLLATATDNRRRDGVHPAFSTVIKEISAEEASLLPLVLAKNTPLGEIQVRDPESEDSGYVVVATLLTPFSRDGEALPSGTSAVWLANWARMGLVEFSFDKWVSHAAVYESLESHPEYTATKNDNPSKTCVLARGVMVPTALGRRFLAAVSS